MRKSRAAFSMLIATAGLMAATASPAWADQEDAESEMIVRDNGLKIQDLVVGDGPVCPEGATVVVNCIGTLDDGSVFWASEEGEPVAFPLTGVIPGWQQGLPGMRVGGTRKLVIPPELGYGAQGRPPVIPANSTLTFEIELLALRSVRIKEIEEGEGDPCPPGAIVKINYEGRLEDGTVFDSSEGKGAARFILDQLIEGWKVGIPGMRRGGKRTLYVPYEMGYGDAGRPPKIPPKANLVFDVELVDFIYPEYETLEVGAGDECQSNSRVVINYKGTLPDGEVFVSTEEEGPIEVEMDQLLLGLKIGMKGMQPGEKRIVTVPPEWAYAQRDSLPLNVPPRTKLIFEVELLEIR